MRDVPLTWRTTAGVRVATLATRTWLDLDEPLPSRDPDDLIDWFQDQGMSPEDFELSPNYYELVQRYPFLATLPDWEAPEENQDEYRRPLPKGKRAFDAANGQWKTINGAHVFIGNARGMVLKGPSHLLFRKEGEVAAAHADHLAAHAPPASLTTPLAAGAARDPQSAMDGENYLEARHQAWQATLTPDEADAVGTYINGDYATINEVARVGHRLPHPEIDQSPFDLAKVKATIARLDAAVAKGTLDEPVVARRGFNDPALVTALEQGRGVGTTATDDGFMSVSVGPLSHGGAHLLVTTRLPAGTKAAIFGGNEREVLLPRGSGLKVTAAQRDGNQWNLTADYVPPSPDQKKGPSALRVLQEGVDSAGGVLVPTDDQATPLVSKRAVNYVSQRVAHKCRACVSYRDPAACALVAGSISPLGGCDLWQGRGTKAPLILDVPHSVPSPFGRAFDPTEPRDEQGRWTDGGGGGGKLPTVTAAPAKPASAGPRPVFHRADFTEGQRVTIHDADGFHVNAGNVEGHASTGVYVRQDDQSLIRFSDADLANGRVRPFVPGQARPPQRPADPRAPTPPSPFAAGDDVFFHNANGDVRWGRVQHVADNGDVTIEDHDPDGSAHGHGAYVFSAAHAAAHAWKDPHGQAAPAAPVPHVSDFAVGQSVVIHSDSGNHQAAGIVAYLGGSQALTVQLADGRLVHLTGDDVAKGRLRPAAPAPATPSPAPKPAAAAPLVEGQHVLYHHWRGEVRHGVVRGILANGDHIIADVESHQSGGMGVYAFGAEQVAKGAVWADPDRPPTAAPASHATGSPGVSPPPVPTPGGGQAQQTHLPGLRPHPVGDVLVPECVGTLVADLNRPISTQKHLGGGHANEGKTYLATLKGDGQIVIKDPNDWQGHAMVPAEVASYRVDRLLGLGILPECYAMTKGKHAGASAERFAAGCIPGTGDEPDAFFTHPVGKRIGLFDQISGNIDRHEGNWLNRDGTPVPIDQGLAFWRDHATPTAFVSDNEDEPIEPDLLARLHAVTREQWDAALGDEIASRTHDASWRNLQAYVTRGTYGEVPY